MRCFLAYNLFIINFLLELNMRLIILFLRVLLAINLKDLQRKVEKNSRAIRKCNNQQKIANKDIEHLGNKLSINEIALNDTMTELEEMKVRKGDNCF